MISFYIDRDVRRLKQVRIAQAITATAPPWAVVLQEPDRADVQVLQVGTLDARTGIKAPRYAVVQHAHRYEHQQGERAPIVVPLGFNPWEALWSKALAVWSPVDVAGALAKCSKAVPFIAPFGVDFGVFRPHGMARDVGIVTSGHSNISEAIQEPAAAAFKCGLTTVHLGPWEVAGLNAAMPGRSIVNSLTDNELAALYSRAKWVSGLRYYEGFELPVLEGLACGARPLAFDTPDNRMAYQDHAVYLPVCEGEPLVQALAAIMAAEPQPVDESELQAVQARYDWERLARGYWGALEAACKADSALAHRVAVPPAAMPATPRHRLVAVSERRRRLLWIGDSPTTPWTGFGRAAFNVLQQLHPEYEVHALGTTFDGFPFDRTAVPYEVYPIIKGVPEVLRIVQPDVVVAQHDPWHVQQWLRDAGKVPVVGIMPIDGKNCKCDQLNELAMAIWWTKTSEQEARIGGYTGPSCVIPLGVDLEMFSPVEDKRRARASVGLPEEVHDKFIVGVVARNQSRKRLDLTVRHFAEWVHTKDVRDAYLYVQTAPTGEAAYDVASLMRYEKLEHRMLLVTPALYRTLPDGAQAGVMNSLDVYFTTTQGEGWGLPVMEAMACGVPVVAPDWSALGDWARDAAVLVPCCDVAGTINSNVPPGGQRIAVLGGVPSIGANVEALHALYTDRKFYGDVRALGLTLVGRDEYRWPNIGQAVLRAVDEALAMKRNSGAVLQPVLG